MKICLYGLPSAGKSYILDKVDFLDRYEGSKTMKALFPEFDNVDEYEKKKIREKFASYLQEKEDFIIDGHYSFGDEKVFTQKDGELYDVFLYLYVNPQVLKERMKNSQKNQKYSSLNIETWQNNEVIELRDYCQKYDKDFYVIDNPSIGYFESVDEVIDFIKVVYDGYSCVKFSKECTAIINKNKSIQEQMILFDGDKTITTLDMSGLYGYTTDIFDNNFYTGYQTWKHNKNYRLNYITKIDKTQLDMESLIFNDRVVNQITPQSYILTSGDEDIWKKISNYIGVDCFYGNQMSADTKYFITKFLRQSGKYVIAYGDSKNDYYMLREADEGYLVTNQKGLISKSLANIELGDIKIV